MLGVYRNAWFPFAINIFVLLGICDDNEGARAVAFACTATDHGPCIWLMGAELLGLSSSEEHRNTCSV